MASEPINLNKCKQDSVKWEEWLPQGWKVVVSIPTNTNTFLLGPTIGAITPRKIVWGKKALLLQGQMLYIDWVKNRLEAGLDNFLIFA